MATSNYFLKSTTTITFCVVIIALMGCEKKKSDQKSTPQKIVQPTQQPPAQDTPAVLNIKPVEPSVLTPPSSLPAEMSKKMYGPCAEDFVRHCSSGQDERGMMKCSPADSEKFSAECKVFLAKQNRGSDEAIQICSNDIKKMCANKIIKAAHYPAIMQCLSRNATKLSDSCKMGIARLIRSRDSHLTR